MSGDLGPGRVRGTGVTVPTPSQADLDRRRARLSRPGEHMWIIVATWRITDPERVFLEGADVMLDAESMVGIAGPGCFHCEREYSRKLARMPCTGNPSYTPVTI